MLSHVVVRSCVRKTDEEEHQSEPDVEAATPLKWDKDDEADDEWVRAWQGNALTLSSPPLIVVPSLRHVCQGEEDWEAPPEVPAPAGTDGVLVCAYTLMFFFFIFYVLRQLQCKSRHRLLLR